MFFELMYSVISSKSFDTLSQTYLFDPVIYIYIYIYIYRERERVRDYAFGQ